VKDSGACAKCGSPDVVRVPDEAGAYGAAQTVRAGNLFQRVQVSRYVCATCGFVEQWIDDADDLRRIADRYRR
jgi:predicted RNA-binding Zn-ribbon protein involved in translation (DUF1610 family)